MRPLLIAMLFSALATAAFAHSRMETTTPDNGATLAEAPTEIEFNFEAEIRLTRVEMTHQDQTTTQLDLGEQAGFVQRYTLPFQGMGAGSYRIEWRGLSVDGHVMQGTLSFTVE